MRTFLAGLALSFFIITSAPAAVTLIINNQSGQPDSNIWIQWSGQTTPAPTGSIVMSDSTTALNGSSGSINPIVPTSYTITNTGTLPATVVNDNLPGYQLSTLASTGTHTYQINNFTMRGGRMYFTYGSSGYVIAKDSSKNPILGYTPPLNNFNDPNFLLRTDKVEAFIVGGTTDNLDMTAVDGFAIPFQITGFTHGTATQILRSTNGGAIISSLIKLCATPSAATAPSLNVGTNINGPIVYFPPPPYPPGTTQVPVPHITYDSPYLDINSGSLGLTTTFPFTYSPLGAEGSFVRVIGNDQNMLTGVFYQDSPRVDPVATTNGNQIPQNYLYAPFNNYLSYLDGTATPSYTGSTTISGTFVGVADAASYQTYPQTYNLVATLNPTGSMTFSGKSYTGYLTLVGSTTLTGTIQLPGGGQTQTLTMRIPYALMLDPTGIIGANAGYQVTYGTTGPTNADITTPLNDVFTWIEGDYFSGLNIGTIGSTKTFTGTLNGHTYNNAQVGSMPSQDWFFLGQALTAVKAGPTGKVWDYYFSYLQSNPDFYNTWASTLYPLTDAYNFAYSDRVHDGNVAIAWNVNLANAVDTIEITILPDDQSPLNGEALDSAWFYLPLFGYYNELEYPWVNHDDLGFMYFNVPTGTSDMYLYASDAQLGWLYTNPAEVPFMYSYQEGTWLYFFAGATVNNFYNFSTQKYETHLKPSGS